MVEVNFVLTSGETLHATGDAGFSVMEVAVNHSIPGIAAYCGGCISCGTCHAYLVPAFANAVPPPNEAESAMLENVADPRPESRLTCQIILSPELSGITFEVPASPF